MRKPIFRRMKELTKGQPFKRAERELEWFSVFSPMPFLSHDDDSALIVWGVIFVTDCFWFLFCHFVLRHIILGLYFVIWTICIWWCDNLLVLRKQTTMRNSGKGQAFKGLNDDMESEFMLWHFLEKIYLIKAASFWEVLLSWYCCSGSQNVNGTQITDRDL